MMTLDTCVLIWEALAPELISHKAKQAINVAAEKGPLQCSTISLLEIGHLIKQHRIEIDASYKEFIDLLFKLNRYQFIPMTPEIIDEAMSLPDTLSQDPADRIIVATALVSNSKLITADKQIRKSTKIKTIW